MLNKNAKKWVAALRGGKYKQGKNRLTWAGRHCCLGVACAICPIAPEDWKGKRRLPSEVVEWLGLNSDMGRFEGGRDFRSLANLNDNGKEFTAIADIIESEPEGLFKEGSA